MEDTCTSDHKMVFLSMILFGVVAIFTYFFLTRRKYPKPLPPGPKGWELVHAFFSAIDGTLPLQTERWAKEYGEVVYCPLPLGNLVFLTSPSATKELYSGKETDKFANDRMWSYVADKLCLRKCVSFSSPRDKDWLQMRKLLHSCLKFYGEGVADFEKTVGEALDNLVTALEEKDGEDVEIKEYIEDSITGILVILLKGEFDKKAGKAMKKFNATALPVLDFSFTFAIKILPFLDYIPGTSYTQARRNVEEGKKNLMECVLEETKHLTCPRATRVPGKQRGIVDKILDFQSNQGTDSMTDDHVKGIIMDIVVAGITTSTHTLTTMMFYLIHRPDVLHRIQEEVDKLIGPDRKPTLNDRRKFHYTEAFILETMRVLSLLPLGADHYISEDLELKGYFIPKGSVVFNKRAFSATYAFHKSKELWTDPDSFKPERFLDDEGELLPATHPTRLSLLPFGTGKRSCPGETFARARIFLFITTLFQHFNILPPAKEPTLAMERDSWIPGFVIAMKPYRCRFVKRQTKA